MTDRIFLRLNDDWSLGYDDLHWIVCRVYFKRDTARFLPVSFIGSTRAVLYRVIRENGIEPTPEAQVALDAMPDTFREWLLLRDNPQRRAA